jgi:hypothetical protein
MNDEDSAEHFQVRVSTEGDSVQGSELWAAANKVRESFEGELVVSIKSVNPRGAEDVKSGVIEGVIVLIGLASYATRPLQRFIIDLLKELRLRNTHTVRIKMPGFEFDYHGAKTDKTEDLEGAVRHALEQRGSLPASEMQARLSDPIDLEIIVGTESAE